MMTLCTVVPEGYEDYTTILLDSVRRYFKHVSAVLMVRPNYAGREAEEFDKRWEEGGIKYRHFTTPAPATEHGHAFGLHACIDAAETDYLFFTDPDVFYKSAADELYLSLYEKYGLNYIGCSHHSSVANAYSFYPYVMSSMLRKSDLPPPDWLKGLLKVRNGIIMVEGWDEAKDLAGEYNFPMADGKFLLASPVPGRWRELPNIKPNVFFDCTVNLCLWSIEQNWKWLSFQTPDAHNYTTKFYKTTKNLKVTGKLPQQAILYHSVRNGACDLKANWEKFLEEAQDES